MNITDLLLKGLTRYFANHPDKVEQLIASVVQALVTALIGKLLEHNAANPIPAPVPAAGELKV